MRSDSMFLIPVSWWDLKTELWEKSFLSTHLCFFIHTFQGYRCQMFKRFVRSKNGCFFFPEWASKTFYTNLWIENFHIYAVPMCSLKHDCKLTIKTENTFIFMKNCALGLICPLVFFDSLIAKWLCVKKPQSCHLQENEICIYYVKRKCNGRGK